MLSTTAQLAATAAQVSAIGPSWLDPNTIINSFVSWLGPFALLGVCLVIFAETGLLIGFFLPGDSLLFTLGIFTAGDNKIGVPLWIVLISVFVFAFAGDQCGYLIGRKAGPKVFDRPDSRLFKREYVDKTNAYFDKYGGRTIILARFVPIVRTFAPVAAGVGKMKYRHFVSYNVFGGLLWAPGVTLLGCLLGNIAFVRDHIDLILVAIVVISIVPMVVEVLRARHKSKKAKAAQAHPAAHRAAD